MIPDKPTAKFITELFDNKIDYWLKLDCRNGDSYACELRERLPQIRDEIIRWHNECVELKRGILVFFNQPSGRFIITAGEKDIEISKGSSITLELDVPKELRSLKEDAQA